MMQPIRENTSEDMYPSFAVIKECYDALTDELSRKVFQARMAFDLGEWNGYIELIRCSGLMSEEEIQKNFGWVETYVQSGQPIYIYGAGQFGGHTCQMLQKKGVNVVGFFDHNYANIVERCGLPVLAPPTEGNEELRILVSLSLLPNQIIEAMYDNGLVRKNFLGAVSLETNTEHQYFDFPEHFDGAGIFIDAGCYDFQTAVRFHNWSQGHYSKIISFEPDKSSIAVCKENARCNSVNRVDFIQAGLWSSSTSGTFGVCSSGSSRIIDAGDENILLVALDDIVGNQKVSFIKMDIEGSELAALQGAAKTITRDKPLCALSVYHKPGDQIALMQYLKELVPEYRFTLRHYTNLAIETVLYAFVYNNGQKY